MLKLREWRKRAGLTQAQLGSGLDLSQSQVARYEADPDSIRFGLRSTGA